MFKTACQEPLRSAPLNPFKGKDPTKPLSDNPAIAAKQKAIASGKADLIANASLPDPAEDIGKSFNDMKGNLSGALNKEMKFEQLVENEEVEKEEKKKKVAKVAIEVAKTTDECLEEGERKSEDFQRTEMARNNVKDLIGNLKDSVKNMIIGQRAKESNKIRVMRKLKKKAEKDEAIELQDVRSAMASELTKTYKKGSEKPCIKPQSTLNMATDTVPYCKEHYKDEPADYEECIKP